MHKEKVEIYAIPNSKDNSRCVACCVAGIINAFKKEKIFSRPEELDKSLFRLNKGINRTWQPIAAYILSSYGLKVTMNVPMPITWQEIYKFGLKSLDKRAIKRLEKYFDISVFNVAVQKAYEGGVKMKSTGYKNIKKLFSIYPSSCIMVGVNPYLLYNSKSRKKEGHYVLVKEASDSFITISDPGLPYIREINIPKENFDLAWKGDNPYKTGEAIIATPKN